jgi:hypothetical protein
MTAEPITAEYFAKRAINFALTQPQAQRIHRALLLLEMVEDEDGAMFGSSALIRTRNWLLACLDAASKEMETHGN